MRELVPPPSLHSQSTSCARMMHEEVVPTLQLLSVWWLDEGELLAVLLLVDLDLYLVDRLWTLGAVLVSLALMVYHPPGSRVVTLVI